MYNVGATIKIGSGDKAQGKMLSGQEPEVLNRLVKENEALRKANEKQQEQLDMLQQKLEAMSRHIGMN